MPSEIRLEKPGIFGRDAADAGNGGRPPGLRAWDYARQLAGVGTTYLLGYSVGAWGQVLAGLGFHRNDAAYWQGVIGSLLRVWVWAGRGYGVIDVDLGDLGRFRESRGVIFAANHPSLVDAFALLSVLPRAVCVMRSDLRVHPALGALARLARYITSDRGPALVRDGLARLARGDNLVIFPEGTRTRGQLPEPFKRGFALMATKSGARVQTVLVTLDGEYFRKGCGLMAPVRLPVKLKLRAGAAFTPTPGESADAFATRIEAYFRSFASKRAGEACF